MPSMELSLREINRADKGRLAAYRVVMKPYRSVLATISEIPGVTVYVEGISLRNDVSTTLAYIDMPENPEIFEEVINKLKNSSSVIEYQLLEKKKYSLSIAVTKNVCDFYRYTLQAHRFTFFPYLIKDGQRAFYLVSSETPHDIFSHLSRHGHLSLFEKVPLSTAMKNTGLLSLKLVVSDSLTPSQRTILREAYKRGYYDWPRKISLSDLADEFHLSKATLSEHLRRGEQKLFNLFLDSL